MAKPASGRCVHCLEDVEAITDDHLFPRSWYPTTTPPNIEKWKFPSCRRCNGEYGRLEEELRLALATCVDPKSAAAAGIWPKARDSIDPTKAKSPLDKLKRGSAQRRFLRRVTEVDPSMSDSLVSEIRSDRPKGQLASFIPAWQIGRFIEKLTRGTIYVTEKRYIETNQTIKTWRFRAEHDEPIVRLIEAFGELYERGPGIRIRKAVAQDAMENALFVFDIWDQFRFFGAVLDHDTED